VLDSSGQVLASGHTSAGGVSFQQSNVVGGTYYIQVDPTASTVGASYTLTVDCSPYFEPAPKAFGCTHHVAPPGLPWLGMLVLLLGLRRRH